MGKIKELIAKILLAILIIGQISPITVLASQQEQLEVEEGGEGKKPIEVREEEIEKLDLEDQADQVNKRERIEVTNEEELRQALESSSQVDREVILMNNITIENKGLVINGKDENIRIRGREDEKIEWDQDGNYKSGIKLIIEGGPQLGIRLKGSKITIENLAIDGSNKSLVIYREEGSKEGKETVLDRVLIQNARRGLNGSALRTNTLTKIKNSCFSNNESTAGGIINFHTNDDEKAFQIENTKIVNNQSTSGGAINIKSANLNIKDSNISKNKSNYGGAIYSKDSKINIGKTSLENNESLVGNGGAIFADSETEINIKDSKLSNNKSAYYGGAIGLYADSSLELSNSQLEDNKAELDPNVDRNGSYGGAIFAYLNNEILIDGGEFKANSSDKDNAISASINNKIAIKNSSFKEHNHGQVDLNHRNSGGVIGVYKASSLDIENSNFEKNKSYIGGAIYSNGEELNISKSTFLGNQSEIGGGAVFFNGGKNNLGERKFYIENSKISNNISNTMGGAIRLERPVDMKIKGGEFKNNKLNGDNSQGGFMNVSNFDGKIEIDSALFEGNQASNAGAIKISNYDVKKTDKKEVEIKNSQFRFNKARDLGGAIEISSNQNGSIADENNYNIKIINTKFEENQAEKGGALKSSSPARLEIIDSDFLKNQAIKQGGALYINNHKSLKSNPVIIENTNFRSNKSGNKGGALSLEEESLVNIDGGEFKDNQASFGGAISASYDREGSLNNSSLNIKSTKFNENIAQRKEKSLPSSIYDKSPLAGGIYVEGYIVNLEKILAKENKTLASDGSVFGKGGFLYIENSSKTEDKGQEAEVLIDGGVFESNEAGYGGVIGTGLAFNEPIGKLEIKNGASFKNNKAERIAGFLYAFEKGKKEADRILKESIFIDDSIKLENNQADERRFIDGFKGKYEKYKDDLTKNIKTKEKSKGTIAFNNHDINMLGYEYLLLHKDPFTEEVREEVYKEGEKISTKYKPGYSFEKEVEEDGYRIKYKYTLKDWDMDTYILNNFDIEHKKEKNLKDPSKEYSFSYDDILFEGNYEREIISKEEIEPEKPIKPEKPIEPEKPTEPEKPIEKGIHQAYISGFPDGTVRPEQGLTRQEAVTILYRMLDRETIEKYYKETADFTDIKDTSWSKEYIGTLSNMGVVSGYPDGSFKLDKKITRGELAKLVSFFKGEDKKIKIDFADIEGHWAEEYIKEAVSKGWIDGHIDGTFKPDKDITRAEFIVIVNRVFKRTPKLENTLENIRQFKDLDKNKWYYVDIIEASNSHSYKIENGQEVWLNLE